MLAAVLLLIALMVGGYLAVMHRWRNEGDRTDLWSLGLIGGTTLLLCLLIGWMIGGAGLSGDRPAARVEFTGIGIDPGLPQLVISGSGTSGVDFVWSGLAPESRITIRQSNEQRTASFIGPPSVVRIDGECVWAPVSGWIPVGKDYEFEFRYLEDEESDSRAESAFSLKVENGTVRVQSPYDQKAVAVSLKQNLSLRDLLSRASAPELLKRLEKAALGRSGRPLLSDAYVVRRVLGDGSSEVGLLADLPVRAQPIPLKGTRLRASRSEERRIPDLLFADELVQGRQVIRLDPAPRYELPPSSLSVWTKGIARVQIATATSTAKEHGYLFRAGQPWAEEVSIDPRRGIKRQGAEFVPPNQMVGVGSGSVIPMVTLRDGALTLSRDWWQPILGILGGAFILGRLFWDRLRSDATAHHLMPLIPPLWATVCSILTVRAILSFRISALIPEARDGNVLDNYRDAWMSSNLTLIAASIGLALAAVWASRQKGKLEGFDQAPSWLHVSALAWVGFCAWTNRPNWLLVAIVLYGVALALRGLSGARTNPETDVDKNVGLAVLAVSLLLAIADPKFFPALAIAYWLWRRGDLVQRLPIFVFVAVCVVDQGYLIYVPAALFAWLASPRENKSPRLTAVAAALAILLAILPFRILPIEQPMMRLPVVRDSVMALRTAEYRGQLASASLDPSLNAISGRPQTIRQTEQQRWLMDRHLAAAGIGMFRAPVVEGRGMTLSTYTTDTTFASLLVAEHGKLAGWVLTLLQCLIGATILYGAREVSLRKEARAISGSLVFLALMFLVTAPYMALANLWRLPFTGQNLPLLGLTSVTDAPAYLVLILVSVILLGTERSRLSVGSYPASPILIPIGLAAVWLVQLGVFLNDPRGKKEDPDKEPALVQTAFQTAVREAVNQRRRADESLPLTQMPALLKAVPRILNLANEFDDATLLRQAVRLPIRAASPFIVATPPAWQGDLTAQGVIRRGASLNLGGHLVTLNPQGQSIRARIVNGQIECQETNARYVEIFLKNRMVASIGHRVGSNEVEVRQPARSPEQVTIDDVPLDGKQGRWARTLTQGARILISYKDADGQPQRVGIRYEGAEMEESLTAVRWRNGNYVRLFPLGADFPLAHRLAEAASIAATKKSIGAKDEVALSLNLNLQRRLMMRLRTWGQSQRPLRSGSALWSINNEDAFTAIVAMDPFSGQLRAIASIPSLHPESDLAEAGWATGKAEIGARSSFALFNRTVGSTFKPMTYSALAQSFWGDLDFSTVRFSEQRGALEGRYRRLGDLVLDRGISFGEEKGPGPGTYSMAQFLQQSRTYGAMATGVMGLGRTDQPWDVAFADGAVPPGERGPLVVNSRERHLRLAKEPFGDVLFTSRTGDLPSTNQLDESRLFTGLRSIFDNVQTFDERGAPGSFQRFLPFALPEGTVLPTGTVPESHLADATLLTDPDSLFRYIIGGKDSRWNAVHMAENFSRVITGKRVSATLKVGGHASNPLPKPLGMDEWRNKNLVEVLKGATTLDAEVRRAVPPGYQLAYKTGTIEDGVEKGRSSHLLALAFGRPGPGGVGFEPGETLVLFISVRSGRVQGSQGRRPAAQILLRIMPDLKAYLEGRL